MSEENVLKTAIILLFVFLISLIPVTDTEYSTPEVQDPNHGLALSLNENGWELYTSASCSACQYQKKVIGNEYDNIIKFELGTKEFTVMASYINITGVPTWFNTNTGEKRTGAQTLSELWIMTKSE